MATRAAGHDERATWPRGSEPASTPTKALARLASTLDIAALDTADRRAAKRHLLDALGATIAGAAQPIVVQVAALLQQEGAAGVPVIGLRRRLDVLSAAYVTALSCHALEVDDGCREGGIHPGAVVIPVALSIGYERDSSGAQLLAAIVAGYESAVSIAEVLHPAASRRGFQPTGAFGVFGAAAAAGRLLALEADVMESALGIAASSAAGLFAFLSGGATVKKLHPAHAAREGLWAALLASQSVVRGPANVLEAKGGVLQAFGGLAQWPDAHRHAGTGLGIGRCYIKPYPCCRHIHPAIDAVLALRARHAVDADEVARVVVGTHAAALPHAAFGWRTLADAQLSFPYVIAAALRSGAVDLQTFSDVRRTSAAAATDAAKVEVVLDSNCAAAYPARSPARVTLIMRDGREYAAGVADAAGSAASPVSDEFLFRKFRSMTSGAMTCTEADGLIEQILCIDQAPSIRPVLDAIVRAVSHRAHAPRAVFSLLPTL